MDNYDVQVRAKHSTISGDRGRSGVDRGLSRRFIALVNHEQPGSQLVDTYLK